MNAIVFYMLGLQCSESTIRAVAASKSGQLLTVQARAEQSIKKGAIRHGDIENRRTVLAAVKQLKKSLAGSSRRVTLCLSPELVHSFLLRIPTEHEGTLAEAMHRELESKLPDGHAAMNVQYTPLRRDAMGMLVATRVVPKNVLDDYESVLKEAGLRVGSVTTSGMALGAMIKHVDTFLLINAEDASPSIVVFYGGHPVYEVPVRKSDFKEMATVAQHLLEQYMEDGLPIQHIAIHGTKELYEQLHQRLAPKKRWSNKKKELQSTVTVEHILPLLRKRDLAWGGIIASSLGSGVDIRLDRVRWGSLAKQFLFAAVFLSATGYFMWIVGGTPLQSAVRGFIDL